MTGVGTGGSQPRQTQSRQSMRAPDPVQQNGAMTNGRTTPNVGTRPADPQADPIDPTARTMLKVGQNAYEVNLDRDPQARPGPATNGSHMNPHVGQDDDPLARQMNELKNANSVRRSGQFKAPPPQQSPPGGSGLRRDPGGKLSPPPGGAPPPRDYRNSAEIVVGSLPPQVATSRPASPNPITNVFMKPPQSTSPGGVSVQNVLADYQQSLPGERKSISRPSSRANSISGPPQGSDIRGRPLSGQAGIGAQGRSTSPQPFASMSRSASPAMQEPPPSNRNSYRAPSAAGPPPGQGHAHSGSNARQGSISIPQQPMHQQRPTSPGIGIQLDPNGRVVADDMAQQFRAPQQQPPAQPYGAPQQPQQVIQRRPSYNAGPNGAPYVAPPQQYSGAPPFNGPPGQQQYGAPPPQPTQSQMYSGPPQQQYPQYNQPPPPQQQQQPPQGYGQQQGALVQRGPSVNGGYYPPQQPPQQQQQYRAPSPRAPSPQPPQGTQPPPTGQFTDDGRGVLFYGASRFSQSHASSP